MLARMVASARLLPLRWWAVYALYAAAVITVGVVWYPQMVGFGVAMVVVNLLLLLANPARPPARHRRKGLGSQHLAE